MPIFENFSKIHTSIDIDFLKKSVSRAAGASQGGRKIGQTKIAGVSRVYSSHPLRFSRVKNIQIRRQNRLLRQKIMEFLMPNIKILPYPSKNSQHRTKCTKEKNLIFFAKNTDFFLHIFVPCKAVAPTVFAVISREFFIFAGLRPCR